MHYCSYARGGVGHLISCLLADAQGGFCSQPWKPMWKSEVKDCDLPKETALQILKLFLQCSRCARCCQAPASSQKCWHQAWDSARDLSDVYTMPWGSMRRPPWSALQVYLFVPAPPAPTPAWGSHWSCSPCVSVSSAWAGSSMRAAPCAPLTSPTEPGIQQVLHGYLLGANIQKVSLRRSLVKAESLPESGRKLYVPKGRYVIEDSRLPFRLEGKKSPVCPRGGWHAPSFPCLWSGFSAQPSLRGCPGLVFVSGLECLCSQGGLSALVGATSLRLSQQVSELLGLRFFLLTLVFSLGVGNKK